MYLRAGRSYSADRELLDNNFFNPNDVYSGPAVNDIRNLLRNRR
jgi:hypothetical protein